MAATPVAAPGVAARVKVQRPALVMGILFALCLLLVFYVQPWLIKLGLFVTLTVSQIPAHTHPFLASTSAGSQGNPAGNVTAQNTLVQIYAEETGGTAELKVRDEAGNITTLSPHRFTLFDPPPDQPLPFSFYSRNPSHQSTSRGNFPQFLLCGCYFSTLVFAKTPRSGVGPARRLNSRSTVNHRLILSLPHLQPLPEN